MLLATPERLVSARPTWTSGRWLDIACLCAVVLIPAATYVGGLGFYSDDWHFLASVATAPDQSFLGAARALAPDLVARPPQLVANAALFQVFHLSSPGYHVVDTLLLLC